MHLKFSPKLETLPWRFMNSVTGFRAGFNKTDREISHWNASCVAMEMFCC